VIDTDGSVDRSSGGVTATYLGTGDYAVDFNTNVSQCAYITQIGGTGTSAPPVGIIQSFLRAGFTDQVHVETLDGQHPASGTARDRPFHIAVHC
jgi:hypothetical protein